MNILRSDFGLIFWTHLTIVIASYLSPFLFGWKIIASYITFFFIQIFTIKGCILSKWQFKDQKIKNFHLHYLNKLGIKINPNKVKKYSWIIPLLILSLALIWQLLLNQKPLII